MEAINSLAMPHGLFLDVIKVITTYNSSDLFAHTQRPPAKIRPVREGTFRWQVLISLFQPESAQNSILRGLHQ